MPGVNLVLDPNLRPPTDTEAKLLRQIILAGMPDQVGCPKGEAELNFVQRRKLIGISEYRP